jgi:hypothetical protein
MSLKPVKGFLDISSVFLHTEEHLEQLSPILPGGIVSLDDGLNQVNHGLWFLSV